MIQQALEIRPISESLSLCIAPCCCEAPPEWIPEFGSFELVGVHCLQGSLQAFFGHLGIRIGVVQGWAHLLDRPLQQAFD